MMEMAILSKLGFGLGLLLAVGSAIFFFGEARFDAGQDEERARWEAAADKADKEILRLNVALVHSQLTAAQTYGERLDAQEPIILHDRETIREYAARPDGAVRCLDPERVRDIEATAAARGLGYSTAAGGGAEALHPDPAGEKR